MSIRAGIKGMLVALAVTAAFIVIMAAVLYFSDIDERLVNIGVYIGTAAGVAAGAVAAAKSAGRKVLLHCLMTGILYLAVMAAATLIIKGGIYFNYRLLAVVAGVIACSIFGAVIGRV